MGWFSFLSLAAMDGWTLTSSGVRHLKIAASGLAVVLGLLLLLLGTGSLASFALFGAEGRSDESGSARIDGLVGASTIGFHPVMFWPDVSFYSRNPDRETYRRREAGGIRAGGQVADAAQQ
jgi:hypothetical protein